MGHLLLTLCLLAAASDKPVPAEPRKASPTRKKPARQRARPPAPPQEPSAPAPTARTKTAMA